MTGYNAWLAWLVAMRTMLVLGAEDARLGSVAAVCVCDESGVICPWPDNWTGLGNYSVTVGLREGFERATVPVCFKCASCIQF